MCGIAGIKHWQALVSNPERTVQTMVTAMEHRGPDGHGLYQDDEVALGHTRLSLIDLMGGQQPMCNEDGSLWLVCNGEIFNYLELTKELKAWGHHFTTQSDVEVILHLYEDVREDLFSYLNGQYAFALWEPLSKKLMLARDHVGICPLYYTKIGETFAFASEMKALFQLPRIQRRLSFKALAQVFTFWSPLPGETPFEDVYEVKPGYFMTVDSRGIQQHRYWTLYWPSREEMITDPDVAQARLESVLTDAVRLRLRSDVPVGTYLSGGLDSSITTALVQKNHTNSLHSFSVGFENPDFDETKYQEMVTDHLHTTHASYRVRNAAISDCLKSVIWYAEKPILRTAPAPLFLLSRFVNDSGFKVVLTGEGADEFFGGYNVYKETRLRCFNARQPNSRYRPLLFQRLYPYLNGHQQRNISYWQDFFQLNLIDLKDPYYSHRIRWHNSSFLRYFLSDEIQRQLDSYDPITQLSDHLDDHFYFLDPLHRAFFLESYIFLSGYLLCSQGDRMLMSHSVEGRYPFLDRRVIELACRLAPELKLKGLNEKWILKRTFGHLLPKTIVSRAKQPYRAPIRDIFQMGNEIFADYLRDEQIGQDRIFQVEKVALLKRKLQDPNRLVSAREEMALMAVLSTEMLLSLFLNRPKIAIDFDQNSWHLVDRRSTDSVTSEGFIRYVTL